MKEEIRNLLYRMGIRTLQWWKSGNETFDITFIIWDNKNLIFKSQFKQNWNGVLKLLVLTKFKISDQMTEQHNIYIYKLDMCANNEKKVVGEENYGTWLKCIY